MGGLNPSREERAAAVRPGVDARSQEFRMGSVSPRAAGRRGQGPSPVICLRARAGSPSFIADLPEIVLGGRKREGVERGRQ